MATPREVITRIKFLLRTLAGAASTALAAALSTWAISAGFDVDATIAQALIVGVMAPLILQAEMQLNRIEKARWFVTLVRFGSSLPVYAHQAEALETLSRDT